MDERQLEIYDFILSLAHKTSGITNTDIASLIKKYCSHNALSTSQMKTQIQQSFLTLSKEISTRNEDTPFSIYGITNENELFEFIHENGELGFLDDKEPKLFAFPLGKYSLVNTENRIYTYEDTRKVSYLKGIYQEIPSYMKKEVSSLSDIIDIASFYLYRRDWHLQSYEDTLKYMVGTPADYLELAVKFFEQQGYPVQRYQFVSLRNPEESHLFLAYQKDDAWYYFEPLFEPFLGIHKYESKNELEQNIMAKFMTYYTKDFAHILKENKEWTSSDKKNYEDALTFQDKAIYDHRLSSKIQEEDPKFSTVFDENCYIKWYQSLDLLNKLPASFAFYTLRRLSSPKHRISYDEYQTYLYYQTKVASMERAKILYEKEQYLLKLTLSQVLIPGYYEKEQEISLFHEIEIPARLVVLEEEKKEQEVLEIVHKYLYRLAYHLVGKENEMIRLDKKGDILLTEGVDLFEINSGKNTYPLVNAKMPYAIQINKENALTFRGAVDYEKLSIEKRTYDKVFASTLMHREMNLIDFPVDFLKEYKLPNKEEHMQDYVVRMGMTSKVTREQEVAFDQKNPKGIGFGQLEKTYTNPLPIRILSYYKDLEDVEKLNLLFDFSSHVLRSDALTISSYLLYMAKTMAERLALLCNQGYYYDISSNIQENISLSGEFLSASFLPYSEEDATSKKVQGIYQCLSFVEPLKALSEASYLITKKHLDNPLETVFIGRYIESLTEEKQELFFQLYQELKEEKELTPLFDKVFKSSLSKENQMVYRDLISILEDFMDDSYSKMMDRVNMILKEQEFMNTISKLSTEDRFVCYLKRRFEDGKLKVKDATFDEICNDSKIGLLLRKEEIMTSSLKTLLTYQISDLTTFYMVGRLLVELATTEDEVRKREIDKTLLPYQVKEEKVNPMIMTIDSSAVKEQNGIQTLPKIAQSTSGMATPFYLLFVFVGMILIVLGVILSFIL